MSPWHDVAQLPAAEMDRLRTISKQLRQLNDGYDKSGCNKPQLDDPYDPDEATDPGTSPALDPGFVEPPEWAPAFKCIQNLDRLADVASNVCDAIDAATGKYRLNPLQYAMCLLSLRLGCSYGDPECPGGTQCPHS